MKLFATALLSILALPAFGHGSFSDSGIEGPRYGQIADEMDTLAKQHGAWAETIDYGQSLGGKTLRMIKIAKPIDGPLLPRPAVLISGATHGNEYLNIADRLPAYFLTNKENLETAPGLVEFLNAGGILYIIPILNPDGYDRDRRHNNNGADLNRDFALLPAREPNFDQPETRNLRDAMDTQLSDETVKLEMTLDYHCCDGSLLFPWSYTRDSLPSLDLERHRDVAYLMQQDIDSSYRYGSTGQVLGYYPRGTSKDYYYAKYGARAYTFEGEYRQEDKNFAKHTVWWDHVFELILEDY